MKGERSDEDGKSPTVVRTDDLRTIVMVILGITKSNNVKSM